MDVRNICTKFDMPGDFVSAKPISSGNINNTYIVEFKETDGV